MAENVIFRSDEPASRRDLVPSEREVESGAVPSYEFTPLQRKQEAKARVPLAQNLRGLIRLLDIRDITADAPALPLILLGYLGFVYALDGSAVALMLPEMSRALGAGGSLIGLLALVGVIAAVFAPLMGFIADRARRVTMLASGSVLSHLSIALTGTVGSAFGFFGVRAIGAAGDLVRQPVGFSLLTDYYPPYSRGRVFAFLGIGGSLGAIAGPIVAGLVGSALGWRLTLQLFGGIAAVASLSFFLLKEPIRGRLDRLAAGATQAAASEEQRPVGWTEGWRSAWSVRTLRHFAFATIFLTPVAITTALLTPFLYADKFHLSPLSRGLVVSLATIPALAGLAMSGPITDRLLSYRPGRVLSLVAGIIMMNGVGLVIFVTSPFLPLTIAFNMIPAFFGALIAPGVNTVISLVVPARIRGLGIQTIAPFGILGAWIPLALSQVSSTSGSANAILYLVPLLLVAAAIIASASGSVEPDIRKAITASMADQAARQAREMGRDKILICRGVGVTYDGVAILDAVDFDVREGELVALLGTNGAGKSSLLRAISGIQQASNGAIFIDGDDVTHLPPEMIAARGVTMMPGGHAIFPTLTVKQNLDLAAWMSWRDPERSARAEDVLRRFPQLRDRLSTAAGNLSGGEQQMVALGQALLMRPRLLLIDELSLGLAPKIVESLLETLREINAAGTSVVIVEQSINVALQVAQRAVYMEQGRIRFDGSVEELSRRPDIVHSVFLSSTSVSPSAAGPARRRADEDEPGHLLEVKDVRLNYGGVQVLNGVNLVLERGTVTGILGPNGAGKTSLFDVITGFAPASSGAIRLGDRDVTTLPPDARARLGLARSYQDVRLFPALTVRENIAVALERHLHSRNAILAAVWSPVTRRSERKAYRRVENLVESLGLEPYASKFLNELSTGTRRIVDIACQLAAQPKLLLLDEPSSGLAQAETEILGPVIGRIVRETGCGVLVIEHDLGLVASVSDRLVAMRLGEVMAEGTPAEVMADEEVMDAVLGGASEGVISRSIKVATSK